MQDQIIHIPVNLKNKSGLVSQSNFLFYVSEPLSPMLFFLVRVAEISDHKLLVNSTHSFVMPNSRFQSQKAKQCSSRAVESTTDIAVFLQNETSLIITDPSA